MKLYDAYELGRAARQLSDRALAVPTLGLNAVPPPLDRMYPLQAGQAASEVLDALRLTHERPAFGLSSIMSADGEVDVREEVVSRTPFASLIRFVKDGASEVDQPKVLIVPGLAGHFATLVTGTITTLLPDHDVYVADWHNARDVPLDAGSFGLDDFIAHVMDFLRAMGPGAHVLSVCQPAVACVAAAAIMAEDDDPAQPSSLILLAGPLDTRVNPSRVSRFAQRQSIAVLERTMLHTVPKGSAGAGRRVYPGFLQIAGFMGMDPRRHVRAFRGLFRDLRRGRSESADKTLTFYREYFAVLDIAGEFYLETAQRIFKDNDLPQGRFMWRGRLVDPSKITSALFTIEGELDEMCTPGQTEAAHALCTGVPEQRKRHLVQAGVGHYGVFAGSTFEREIYPQIRDFVSEADLAVEGSRPAGRDRGQRAT